jgi:ornithine carbamoyltransferase
MEDVLKKDFLSIPDLTYDEIFEIFDLAKELKEKTKRGEPHHILNGYTLAMIFAKPSARTRISFETGIYQLGGYGIYLSPQDIGIGKREAVKDIARVISGYNDLIMARLFAHADIEELAEFASIPVINGLTDYNHPCQIMADAYTILEHKGVLENLKIVYFGDGNNIANSWLNFATLVPLHLIICCPSDYLPDKSTIENAQKFQSSKIEIISDPAEAVRDADIIYADVWASMGQEAEAEARKKIFKPYQINNNLVSHAKKDVLLLHCLPAHRGEEITDEVIEGPNSVIFTEAENRMHVQKAIMVKLAKS